jgi:hypothetical protein
MLSPSDIIVRPASLTERLAPQSSPETPAHPEPTPTTMAERFAPGAPKALPEPPARPPLAEPPIMPGFIPQRAGRGSPGRGLLLASLFVSLVPTALILALLWLGVIAIPGARRAADVTDQGQFAESQHAALAPAPAIEIAPPPVPETKSEIVLSTPGRIEAQTGDEVDFAIAIDSDETLPARSVIAIRAMPSGASFSQGRPYGTTEWNLRPDEVGDLRLRVPETASGSSDLRVELMAADGTILASTTTRLDIASDPRAALILRADESNRVANLIAHGHKMIDVGYFAGARAYFKRAAEAGSGDAALLLGATFDPEFIDKIGAHGIKADPQEARGWYERAKQLGVQDAETKLRALKDGTAEHHPVQATEAQPAAAPPVPVAAEPEPAAPTVPAAPAEAQIAADDSEAGDATQSPTETAADKDQWVALLSYANVRAAPSSTADTLRVAEKGAKLRLTGRKGNWVQVTDPATAEVGWVYSRYIELAEAPAQ